LSQGTLKQNCEICKEKITGQVDMKKEKYEGIITDSLSFYSDHIIKEY
jgi:hypothetical protein